MAHFEQEDPRGEYVLVLEGRSVQELEKEQQQAWEAMTMEEHVAYYEEQGQNRKDAMKSAAKDRGISKRDVYQALLSGKEE